VVSTSKTPLNETIDPNENLTSDGSKTYTWDAENRLVSVSEGGMALASFQYNAFGIRTRMNASNSTTDYFVNGGVVFEERSSTKGTTRYYGGLGIDNLLASQSPAGVRYYTHDHLRSVREATDTVGNVVSRRGYDPWGYSSGSDGFALAGRESDSATGLSYFRARYYNSDMERFLSEDALGRAQGEVNYYAYVLNNPLRYTDPSGFGGPVRWLATSSAARSGRPSVLRLAVPSRPAASSCSFRPAQARQLGFP